MKNKYNIGDTVYYMSNYSKKIYLFEIKGIELCDNNKWSYKVVGESCSFDEVDLFSTLEELFNKKIEDLLLLYAKILKKNGKNKR